MLNEKQIQELKGMSKDFSKKVDVLTKMTKKGTSKLDVESMKHVSSLGVDLKKAMKSAFNGNTDHLNTYIQNANINK